ncbi:chromatin assembly factor 1 subunit A-domain-containing protein [Colletotrichum godetiae]|uniref:Chromatin assembly factor 1 subunit A-domain-containing protein n=1 Tax=Colletotrichum godetiae TaxID=1209918 RepID=A0AAJ0ABC8_9PEZI|nr:chromatin assembly factor 1 subunit A-domain-containing protein [Colletotrichum godetiae]KAK1658466.1 chromatin assembly factor 1 subunit A-domain-containing protein [Colletotrichum godetiae]
MSSNIQRESDMEAGGLKRSHDDFSGDEVTIEDRGLQTDVKHQATEAVVQPTNKAMSPGREMPARDTSPCPSSPSSLTDAGTLTPERGSPSPDLTPAKSTSPLKQSTIAFPASSSNTSASNLTTSTTQPTKRKRRTAAEKEAEEKEKAQKKKEREEKKEAKQAEKAKVDAERQVKQAEKAKADAEKQAKQDEKRRKKEEEERKVQQEKEKKERAQPKLMSFFKAPATPKKDAVVPMMKMGSPSKSALTPDTKTPAVKEELSEYEKRFKPFFVQSSVRLAKSPFEMDDEAHEAKTRILGEYFDGKRESTRAGSFDPVEVFQLSSRPAPRGRIYPPVRFSIEKMRKLTQEASSEEDKKAIAKDIADALRTVPTKSLKFYQDVRPPYRGTVTLRPYQAGKTGMRRLARKPTRRDQLPVNYDHDSEAEWESEGEDVDIDDDDDEDLDADGEDMDEFLDDSEDNGPARFVSANGLEPESTGLCWEDRTRKGPNRTVYEHRMEFILESLEHHHSIDPFSTKYWEPEPKPKPVGRPPKDKAAKAQATKDKPVKTQAAKDKPAADSKPVDAFKALTCGGTKSSVQSLPKKILENNNLEELKKVIEANPKIAKGGLVDLSYVALAHAKISRNDLKEAIAMIAEKVGGKGLAGSWAIKSGFDV